MTLAFLRAVYLACIMATGFAAGASLGWLEMFHQGKEWMRE